MNITNKVNYRFLLLFIIFINLGYADKVCSKCKRIYPDKDSFGYPVKYCQFCKPPSLLKPVDNQLSGSLSKDYEFKEVSLADAEIGYPSHWSIEIVKVIFPLSKTIGIKTCMAGYQGFKPGDLGKSIFLVLPAYIYITPTRWFSFFTGRFGVGW